jgi:hypothetical protein
MPPFLWAIKVFREPLSLLRYVIGRRDKNLMLCVRATAGQEHTP